jgi:hypothetical protein
VYESSRFCPASLAIEARSRGVHASIAFSRALFRCKKWDTLASHSGKYSLPVLREASVTSNRRPPCTRRSYRSVKNTEFCQRCWRWSKSTQLTVNVRTSAICCAAFARTRRTKDNAKQTASEAMPRAATHPYVFQKVSVITIRLPARTTVLGNS